ncbi:MAG: hypothetical protein L3J57_01570 [Desulfuromusa sp.]|nr:hypothetical protein [Desulfuromusa sp.]
MPFEFEQYERMAKLMRSMQGKAILSINDHPEIREVFKGLPFDTVGINYTVGGGGQKSAKRQELIIKNW